MNSTMVGGLSPGDFSFGPTVESRVFDFSATFEESMLSVVPSALLILLAPIRLVSLQKLPHRVGGRGFQLLKLITILLFATLQLILLILWSVQAQWQTRTSIAAAVLAFLDAPIFCFLSYTEHSKSLRPSSILGVYLFFSTLFDAVRLRTMWLAHYSGALLGLFTASLSMKIILLVLEAKEKRRYLSDQDRKKGPEETSGVFSMSLFWWVNKIIRQGFKGILGPEDLYPIDEEMSSIVLAEKFQKHWELTKPGKHRLIRATFDMLTWQTLYPILPRLVLVAFTFCQPLLINRFLKFLQNSDDSMNVGYGLIGAYGIVYFGIAISTGFYWHGVFRWLGLLRGVLVSAIYKKTTEISITALDNSAAVTLMSADVERIVKGLQNVHELWANVIQVGLATWLLQRELGLACIAPVGMALLTTAVTIKASSYAGTYQIKWVEKIQTRIGITGTMLGSMKGVKMSGLTERLTKHIKDLRSNELVAGQKYRMLLVYTAILAFVPQELSPVVTFGGFIGIYNAQGRALDTTTMFTSISLLMLLAQPLAQVFQSLSGVIAAFACIGRIDTFLNAESRADHRLLDLAKDTSEISIPRRTEGLKARLRVHDDVELVNIAPTRKTFGSSTVEPADVIRVRDGAFGWKSESDPILKNINFDIPQSSLTMLIGPVASGKTTLLKALLGETPSSKGFVHVSTMDFSFCDQTPWLLSQSIQQNVIAFAPFDEAWYNTVIHVSCLADDITTFPNGDKTMVGSNGISLSGGQKQRLAIARAVYARRKVAIFDDVFSGLDKTTEKRVFERIFGPNGVFKEMKTTAIVATHAVNLLPWADQIIALGNNGEIVEQGTFAELNSRDGYVRSFALMAQESKDDVEENTEPALGPSKAPLLGRDELADKSRQTGDLSVYKYYFETAGAFQSSLFILACAAFAFLLTFPTVWLKFWSDAVNRGEENTAKWLGGYAALQFSCLIALGFTGYLMFASLTTSAGNKLHLKVLNAVMSAPLLFFTTTDTGITLNRFSQDMQLIDTELPMALLNFATGILECIAMAILIATASAFIAVTYPVILFVFWLVQKYYLRTSRQLRFMDIEAKSPLYTQFLESLSGLATLRAFNWQQDNKDLNYRLLDESQRPFYLLFMVQRWLTMVMDLISMGLALVVVGIAVGQRDSVSPGFTGVSLVNIITFTEALKWVILHWTNLETSIGAVSRVKNFQASTASEHRPIENQPPPENWPTQGLIEINNVTASYKDDKPVLKNINLTIQPGEKIGICGRSGSGKSSLILSLFRMIELDSGSISIDSIPLHLTPRSAIRSQINAIPQEPYFLHGTIRSNIDPWSTQSDAAIESALKKVHLWSTLQSQGGLSAPLEIENLSHGQRQLFCLARSILRPGKIVVLDEATSNVDRGTDKLMQRIIREEFQGHTVVAVAHRLETILDFDTVVVLDAGRVVEVGKPGELMERDGWFRRLYETYERRREDDTGSGSEGSPGSAADSVVDDL